MSYIRSSSVYKYVNEENKDYIFLSCGINDAEDFVEDYGRIQDSTLVEFFHLMLLEDWCKDDKKLKEYMLKKLTEKLGVILRKTPLTKEEQRKIVWKNFQQWKKENEDFYQTFFEN